MIAVHGGASFQVPYDCSKWCAEALKTSDGDVVKVIMNLEEHAYFNCGKGSSLTRLGTVECEACFMSTFKKSFGAVGLLTSIKYPSALAKLLATTNDELGLVNPQVLVGRGAETWASKRGVELIDNSELLTSASIAEHEKSIKKVGYSVHRLDTVGAVSITNGIAEATTSSGGIILKNPGRLGHCTTYGSALWCDSKESCLYTTSVSGCGEALVRTDFCRSVTKSIMNRNEDTMPVEAFQRWFSSSFLNSPELQNFPAEHVFAGGIMLIKEGNVTELLVFHNTPALPIAYRVGKKISRFNSMLPAGSSFKCDSILL